MKFAPLLLLLFFINPSFSQDFEETALDISDSQAVEKVLDEIQEADENPDTKSRQLLQLGTKLVSNYQYEKADQVLLKCLELAQDTRVLADANFQCGLSLMYRDIRLKSMQHFHDALDGYTSIQDSLGMGMTLDKIADNHNYIGEHDTARPYYNQGIQIFSAIGDTALLTNILGNIGGMMSEENINDSALVYYKKAMLLNEQAGNLSNLSSDLAGIAIALDAMGKHKEALNYLRRCYRVAYTGGDDEDKAFANQHLGYYYFDQGNYDSATHYMTVANQFARAMNYGQLLINSLDVLHQSAYATGDFETAYDIFAEANALNDSLLSLQNVTVINGLRSEYEMEKSVVERQALLNQADLREEVINKQAKLNTSLFISAGLFILATIALLGMNRNRQRKNKRIQRDRDLIREQATKLKELDVYKSTFFANIAHDFRTPVSLIKGFMDLIKGSEPNLKAETKEFIQYVEETAERLNKMTTEITQLIQLEEHRYQLTYSEIEINDFFGTIAKIFELGNQDARISFNYQSDVPNGEIINVDKVALEKVIFNILGNAFKYNKTGSQISLQLSKTESNLVIDVTDDGPGIEEDKLDKVFDRYYRTERGTEAATGHGIGLSLAKDLVELHSGTIIATSIPGQKTCFEITLPLKQTQV